ncbi:ABC transporter substrate-binding protein [Streptomyces sviceus]|uniref:ABC transporter substrate-binding protein n=1 Tax=Streptomyces sviceus TaxID=285530 RepID=UPI003695AFFE
MKVPASTAVGFLLAASLSLTACSTSSSGSGASSAPNGRVGGTLTMIYDATFKAALEPVIKAFEQKYPGTKVDVNYVGGDVASLTSTQIQAGTAPDVFLTFPGGGNAMGVQTLASQGRLLDLSDSPWAADIPKAWKSDMQYKQKTYAYPGTLQGLGGIYNETKLKELGLKIPRTWTDVLGLCKGAKGKGVYAYAQGFNDPSGPQMIYLALTGTLIYGPNPDFEDRLKDKTATIPDSPWKEALEKYKEMNDSGCFGDGAMGRSAAQGQDQVAAGKALGIVGVGAALAPLEKAAPKSEFAIAALPATDNPGDTYFDALPGYTISANANAKNPAAAKAFLNLLAEPEHINAYAKGYASVPVIPNAGFKPPAVLEGFNKAVVDGKTARLAGWPNANVNQVAQQGVQAILIGKDSVDGVLKKMQEAYEQ